MLIIADVSGLPILEGKMDELIEDVLLIFINVKFIRGIRTGQITVSLIHAM